MSGPLYVPVLPARKHAAEAYRRLRPDVRAALAPLWNLPPLSATAAGLDALVRKYVDPVSRVHRHQDGWIDAPFAEDAQVARIAEALFAYSELGRLRPVTGPERTEVQQTAALETARRCACGVGVRVRVTTEWDGDTAEAVRSLLARACPAVPVDLMLDMSSVLGDRPEASKEALRALDALVPLAPWRTAAVLGGGFTHVTGDMLEQGLREEPRTDWHMWSEVRASERAYLPLLRYGDYGVQPVSALAQVPKPGAGGPPWGALRYTTENSFVLCKVLSRGPDRIAVNRRAARQIRDLPEFRKATGGAGERWLRDCAAGPVTSGKGTGGHVQWLWVGNAQHLTYVVRCLHGS